MLIIVDTVQAELDSDRASLKESKKDPDTPSVAQSSVQLSETIRMLLLRLGPLRMVETELKLLLGAASEGVREENIINVMQSSDHLSWCWKGVCRTEMERHLDNCYKTST
jgi:hypothetical protein